MKHRRQLCHAAVLAALASTGDVHSAAARQRKTSNPSLSCPPAAFVGNAALDTWRRSRAPYRERRRHLHGRRRQQMSRAEMAMCTAAGTHAQEAGQIWGRRRRKRHRWGSAGILGDKLTVASATGEVGCAAAGDAVAVENDRGDDGIEEREKAEERWIRRLDVAARMIWNVYYSTNDMRDSLESLEVFLDEATAALDSGASPTDLGAKLQTWMLGNAERLDYHFDGDLPMVLYRLWLRGRALDVYERDLLHTPRWIELIAETKAQMDAGPKLAQGGVGGMGTICYPSGEIYEGEVESLIQTTSKGSSPPTSSAATNPSAIDAEVVSINGVPSTQSRDSAGTSSLNTRGKQSTEGGIGLLHDVRTVQGLVALTIECLSSGHSDEAALLKRHMRSPDFGHPLLVLATPAGNEDDAPHDPEDQERNPALVQAEKELTQEHLALGERGAKEMLLDRRRSQLDVYLVCATFRANRRAAEPGLHLHEDDARILDELLSQVAAMNQP